ncbi:MAG: AbrB/MazE/SpoVT family DNA-binding domain-containing protein [Candidatus Woesearchaeota archaeon]
MPRHKVTIDKKQLTPPSKEEREKDIKEIKEGSYPEQGTAKVGVNRGQLFVRIPKLIATRLNLTPGDLVKFTIEAKQNGTQPCKFQRIVL